MVQEEKKITFGDLADALHRLRKKYGIHYNPSNEELIDEIVFSEEAKR